MGNVSTLAAAQTVQTDDETRRGHVEHVRKSLDGWQVPKQKGDPDDHPRDRRPSVLIVGPRDEAAVSFMALLRCLPELEYVELHTAATHATLTGRGFDLVVYLPEWRGAKTSHAAADQWRRAIVQTRFRSYSQKWEIFL